MRDTDLVPSAVLCLLLGGMASPLSAQPLPDDAPRETRVAPAAWLLEQVRLGEARHNEAITDQALERLSAIAPDDPRVLEARTRQALRRQDVDEASRLVERLGRVAPDSEAYRLARLNLTLARPEARSALGQARLLATAGRLAEAKDAYDALFAEGLPTLALALEYWQLVARLPGGANRAIRELQSLDTRYPQSAELEFALARLMLAEGRNAEAERYLFRLSEDSGSRLAAARLWRDALRDAPASDANVAAWERFLSHFGNTEYADEARQTLAEQRRLLANPAYRARQRGLARLAQQQGSAGEADIQRALAAYPDDVELIGALGIIRLRQGRHKAALAQFERAQALDTGSLSGDKWSALIDTARYWQQIRQGDAALANDALEPAEQAYRRASQVLVDDPQAWLGLGDVAQRRGKTGAAERAYRQALSRAPGSANVLTRLAELYASQSPQRGVEFIDGLPAAQQRLLADVRTRLRVAALRAEGDRLAAERRWEAAAQRFTEARSLVPDDVWLTYSLAQALRQQARTARADDAFADLLTRLETPEAMAQGHYAQALYLASDERDQAALAILGRIPAAQRDADMRALQRRLALAQVLARADRLREAGQTEQARRLLSAQPDDADIERRLGDWALADDQPMVAERHYRQALTLAPDSVAARLGLVDAALAQGDDAAARTLLAGVDPPADDLDARRHTANAWAALGELDHAQRQADALAATSGASDDALLLRDTARIAAMAGDHTTALARYRQALAAAELAEPSTLSSDAGFTRALRTREDDDWLASSLRADAAELYRSRHTRVRADRLVQNENGTDGVSALTTTTDMLDVDTPLGEGRGFVRFDRVTLNAGRLGRDADGLNRDEFGTCAAVGCRGGLDQQDRGVSIGVGWYDDTWRIDVGTTPLGFAVTDWVGGIEYSGELGPLWTTAGLSRRPLADSLLSYAGTEDPNTGITWGGVRTTGVDVGLGYDQGGPNGVWSNVGLHHLDGENVPDNQRVRLMGGIYRKLINASHERLSIGLNAMAMHYRENLGGYSLGQGGYYSPRRYLSLSLPIGYRQRTSDWSWSLEAAVSHSWTESGPRNRYPLDGAYSASLPDATARDASSLGGGTGFSAAAAVERRLSTHWRVGLALDAQESEGYSPNAVQFYLRFFPAPWQGDLDLPPTPLPPYAEGG
ncbi:cellulose synthase complex outer membrane protein BcsC [Halomonas organivorans]|uniref:Flp pilus assembly protein TadD n=1 Tax=Halomonas organivorans TaxID=257772 RepID=A0A7W5G5F9_9GAMM|nr:cellulose synthase complex outer membrane protein BcsC [Halomonas organivorans]MBB3141020.1 Flp pilus assembly protein TadD [Halomonas organivorans]